MDIICASCGKHFNSIESAREHRYHCKGARNDEALHWIPSSKEELTQEQKQRLQKLLETIKELHDGAESIKTWQVTSTAEKEKSSIKRKNASLPRSDKVYTSKPSRRHKPMSRNTRGFILFSTLTLALCLIGFGIFLYIDNLTPLFLLLCFSMIFSVERWFRHLTSKYKWISIIYRVVVNISLLALLGYLIWSGLQLFGSKLHQNAIVDSLVYIFAVALFIWLFTVLIKNSWRFPGLKLTMFSLFFVFLVFAFAGVQPMAEYKDKSWIVVESIIDNVKEYFQEDELGPNSNIDHNHFTTTYNATAAPKTTANTKTSAATTTASPKTTILVDGFNLSTGTYKNYFLGLVKAPDGVISGNDCYGKFIVLINNQESRNPTYAELLEFLRTDNTDNYPYLFTFSSSSFFYGSPESHMDLDRLKNIINGIEEAKDPRVCADFAERLHNNAEIAGIRCGYISIDFDDGVGHACNIFETTDKGIVYIDDTGHIGSSGPAYKDAVVDKIESGKQYNPEFLFPSGGWYIPDGQMGVVADYYITWDGSWN